MQLQVMPYSSLVARSCMFVLVLIACTSLSAGSAGSDCGASIVVELKASGSDSRLMPFVRGEKRDFAAALRQLSQESATCGQNRPVNVLVANRRSLGDLNELRGLLAKAGLVSARYYVVSPKSSKMVEIMFGGVVPYPTAR